MTHKDIKTLNYTENFRKWYLANELKLMQASPAAAILLAYSEGADFGIQSVYAMLEKLTDDKNGVAE